MNIVMRLLSGEMPRYVRYCERDGLITDREIRADALHGDVLHDVVHLRGLSTGI